jgi:hypothetical protein
MASSTSLFNSLQFKLLRRRLSVSAKKMSIQARLPWQWRVVLLGTVIVISSAVAVSVLGNASAVPDLSATIDPVQLHYYKQQVAKLRAERDQFVATINAAESQLNIERSAQKQLMTQVKTLEAEKLKLKDDLAFFESLLPVDVGAQAISISRFKADVIAPNQLRYQLLLMKGAKGDQQFIGNLQLVVTLIASGKTAMIVFADGKLTDSGKFKLAFKHYQRVEGVLTLPEGSIMKSVQARILQNGQLRTQHSVNL